MRAGDVCPECPQVGLNRPIRVEAQVARSGEPLVTCPNCGREWGQAKVVALTDAQVSALQCSGVLEEQLDDGERCLARAWDGAELVFHPDDRDLLASALIECANREDEIAEDASEEKALRSGARGARRALTNLIERI